MARGRPAATFLRVSSPRGPRRGLRPRPEHRMIQPNLKSHSRPVLRDRFRRAGLPAWRADQVLSWIYGRGVEDLHEMTDLPATLRDELAANWSVRALETERVQISRDGTRKFVLRAPDGATVEAVLIPEERRNTLCVSTQVGCPLACSFCATGALGFTRNLSAGEIIDQVLRAREALDQGETLTNIVYMGMGEPLLNWPAVAESIRILTDPKTLAMAPRRITVSTSGIVPRIRPLLELGPVNLAISLHATTDAVRDELVPLNRRYPLDELLGALRSDDLISRKRPVFFEYTLMQGINDSLDDARRLPRLLRGIPSKLNLIPMNPHADSPIQPPSRAVCDAFAAAAHAGGLRITLRRNRGGDIDAACGQLAARGAGAGRGIRIPLSAEA
ncbi:MAG: 23S rRNA (adenine(2503)-C(2))-methyltransferase RlmN [Deltaproteobacteria bacterium]|nr:23S rRNA (adenine(2503)-C(2))-methyltransferase RlmN [Deltaproteobacteria bacterium]